jgi:predicted ATP-grasp superfamily ATP-dependent carboligase
VALPSARDPEVFVSSLERLIVENDFDVLMPGTDVALTAIVAHRQRIEPHIKIGLPPDYALARTFDRLALAEAAEFAGLASPPTIYCATPAAVGHAAREVGLPVMVKPRWPVVQRGATVAKIKSKMVRTEAELEAAQAEFEHGECLIQAVVPGHEVSCGGVMTGAGLLAMVVSCYQRSWPVFAGDVCFSTTIPAPPDLAARLQDMLSRLGWTGIFELEMIAADDGSLAAIDLNPRVYGSMALGAGAGAPLAVLWCDWLLGRSPQFALARPGRRYRREDGDLPHAVWQLRHGHLRAGLAPFRPRRRVTHALFEFDDPGPLLARAAELARGRIDSALARSRPTVAEATLG